jgi:hypothetical protein
MSRLQKLLLSGILCNFCRVHSFAATDSGAVSDAALKLFPAYHVLTMAERDSDTRDFITENYPKQDPSVIYADFNGDGHPDYALLLKSDQSKNAKFVVLLCPDDNTCKQVLELDTTETAGIMYLRKIAPGSQIAETDTAEENDRSVPVKLNAPAIGLNCFGKAAVVYYWDKTSKKMASVQTED